MGITDFQGGLADYKGKEDKGSIFNSEPMLGEVTLFNNQESMFTGSMFSGESMFNTENTGEVKSMFNPVPEKEVALFKTGEFTTGRSFTNTSNGSKAPNNNVSRKRKKRAKKATATVGMVQPVYPQLTTPNWLVER